MKSEALEVTHGMSLMVGDKSVGVLSAKSSYVVGETCLWCVMLHGECNVSGSCLWFQRFHGAVCDE